MHVFKTTLLKIVCALREVTGSGVLYNTTLCDTALLHASIDTTV